MRFLFESYQMLPTFQLNGGKLMLFFGLLTLSSLCYWPARATPVEQPSYGENRKLCGDFLSRALQKICFHYHYNSIFQANRSLENGEKDDGLVQMCCYKGCDEKYLRSYCTVPKYNQTREDSSIELPTASDVSDLSDREGLQKPKEMTTETPSQPEYVFIDIEGEEPWPLTPIPNYTSPQFAAYLYDHYETRSIF